MATFNLNVEDCSPLISYTPAGAWKDIYAGNSSSGGSYHITRQRGATARFSFDGIGFAVFGTSRADYGTFTLDVDGRPAGNFTSRGTNPRAALASLSNLTSGQHVVTLTSTGEGMDIDYVQLQTEIRGGSIVNTVTVDGSDSRIVYTPVALWNTADSDLFYNRSLRFTNASDASATIRFIGNAVAVYGSTAPDHADIEVTVDGESTIARAGSSGETSYLHPSVLLYFRTNLGSGEHILRLRPWSPTLNAPFIDLDYVSIFHSPPAALAAENPTTSSLPSPVSDPPAFVTSTTSTPLAEPGPPPALRVGAIVGVALGGLCIAALVMWCLLSLNRRRRVRRHGRLTRSTTSSMFIQKEPPDGDFYSVRREKLPSLQLTPPLQRRSLVPSFYSQESLSRSGSVVSDLSEMEKASLRGKF